MGSGVRPLAVGRDPSVYEYSKFQLFFLAFALLDYQHQYQYVWGWQEQRL